MFYIRKNSGEKQRFDLHKFRRSLFKAGASQEEIDAIIRTIQKEKPRSTNRIHEITTELLQKKNLPVADRYNLKRGLMELGPEGYPFEQFIAHLFSELGYNARTNRIIPGFCVDHEVDIIAQKNNHHYMIECKFHNRPGLKSDVKVALYVQARFEDIRDAWQKKETRADEIHEAWLVTNTQFTTEAIKYALCKNIKLLGWGYPSDLSLAALIEEKSLFPITTLTTLSSSQKRALLKKGLVLCRDAQKHTQALESLGLSPREIKKIIAESQAVCKI